MKTQTVETILKSVANTFNVTVDEIKSNSISPTFSVPRKVCYFILHKTHSLTSTCTGNFIGGRDHATVLTGCKTLLNEASVDSELKKLLDKCVEDSKNIVKNENALVIKCSYEQLFNDVYSSTEIDKISFSQRVKITNEIMAKIIKYI